MKTLLIDNGSSLTEKLVSLVPGSVEIVSYIDIPDQVEQYSLIVLSGSSTFPVAGHEQQLSAEIELIQNTTIPVIGICLGLEIIAHAYGAKLEHTVRHVGQTEVRVLESHPMFAGRTSFSVYENHQYGVTAVPLELQPLAMSDHAIAVLRHTSKPVYGFQFHPEHHTEETYGDEVFLQLVHHLSTQPSK